MDKVINKIIDDVCEKYGVDKHTAELIYSDMFKFIRKTIEEVDFDMLTTEEDLRKARVNFNIPRIFKLYTTPNRVSYAREAIRKSNSKHDEGADADNGFKEEGGE
jgi:hypothetical protein